MVMKWQERTNVRIPVTMSFEQVVLHGAKDDEIDELRALNNELLKLVQTANDALHGTHTKAWQNKAKEVLAKIKGA
jgi:hypothetical protein